MLVAVLYFVLSNSDSKQAVSLNLSQPQTADTIANPLDQISSADVAVNVARLAAMPESVAATNTADSLNNQLVSTTINNSIVAKPVVLSTTFKSKYDIQKYITVSGDTVSSLAKKFGVTSDTLRWSNNLTSDSLPAGRTIWVLPGLDGIVYVVKSGDTASSLAARYRANAQQIIAYNDAEIGGLKPGQRIIIPSGTVQAVQSAGSYFGGFAFGTNAIYGYNGYDYGFCTWYVASKIRVPSNWGNANTWDNLAPLSGWTVSSVPHVGSIAQTDAGGLGHVAIVDAVSPDGKMMKYSDMNGIAGWGAVGQSDWVPISHYEHYISH